MGRYTLDKLPSDVLKEIAAKHRLVRKNAKLSQADFAERSGVSLGSIKRFERTGQISLESFFKLLFALDRLQEFDSILLLDDTERIKNLFSDKTRRS